MKTIRSLYRLCLAYFSPFAFASWVNRDRCYIKIHNDPSGMWHVRIGTRLKVSDRSLRTAMSSAVAIYDHDPKWRWVEDYLKDLPVGSADKRGSSAMFLRDI